MRYLLFLVLSIFVFGCGILEPDDPYLRVGYLTPGDTLIFFAESDKARDISWEIRWDVGSVEGTEHTDVFAYYSPVQDRPVLWIARSGQLADSIMWGPVQ